MNGVRCMLINKTSFPLNQSFCLKHNNYFHSTRINKMEKALQVVLLVSTIAFLVEAGVTYKSDDDSIYFPDDDSHKEPRSAPHYDPMNGTRIPIELLQKMSCVSEYEDFLNFIDPESINAQDQLISNRFGDGMERNNAITPKPAGCQPDLAVVPLHPDGEGNNPSVIYFPSCTRVNRCGGCCSHALLSCQPTATETLTFQVLKSEWNGAKFVYRNKVPILVEQHLKCACDCAVRSEHCNAFQKYDKSQCACYCTNTEERNKCVQQEDLKFWDASNCSCRCRRTSDCTTGSYFNENQCACIKIPVYKSDKEIAVDRRQFIIKAIPVYPNNFTKYETTN